MRKLEHYRVKDGLTPLSGEELNRRFLDIDGRLHQLELLKVSWEQAVSEIQNHGLERINTVIQPVLDAASELVAQALIEINTIKTQWQDILGEWDGVADTLAAMQASLTAMQGEIGAARDYTDAQIAAAVPAAPVTLECWQTDPDQYTALRQDARDSDGQGKNLLYQYVFPAGVFSAIYREVLLPFSGLDIQFTFPYKMRTSFSGGVVWCLYYRFVSPGESAPAINDWSAWAALDDNALVYSATPPATADLVALVSGPNFTIPASAYAAYDVLQIVLGRSAGGSHTGGAMLSAAPIIVPVPPS